MQRHLVMGVYFSSVIFIYPSLNFISEIRASQILLMSESSSDRCPPVVSGRKDRPVRLDNDD